ncbi:Uncharacterized protein PBTT_05240 [Plasmodiophora brassicae]|uniref:Uncharacterized protein n=1 Tax=Plasmodiophora brassicae TaxID=37360 RepID=A0A0G4IR69_PLABS|nr:hypothetical protein PBRA_000979 [Plasmodiophora brassicae]SPQ97930.1 unnamed protein product [Plasmodiophora brassicae]
MGRSLKSKRVKRLNTIKRGKIEAVMSERAVRKRAQDKEEEHRKILPSAAANGKNWREYVMYLNSQSASTKPVKMDVAPAGV